MGVDLLDVVFRLEKTFGVKIDREEFLALFDRGHPSDITVGDLFECVKNKALLTNAFDEDLDAELLWLMFQKAISDSLGVELDEVIKDRGVIRELGAC